MWRFAAYHINAPAFFPETKREKKTSSKILLHPQVPHLEGKKTTAKPQTSIMQGPVPQINLPSSTFNLHKILGTFAFPKVYLCSIQSWLITSTKWHPTCAADQGQPILLGEFLAKKHQDQHWLAFWKFKKQRMCFHSEAK